MSMWQPYVVQHTTLLSKQFHASTGCYIYKTFILYTVHGRKIHEQSTFPRPFIFVFNSRTDSLYLTDRGKKKHVEGTQLFSHVVKKPGLQANESCSKNKLTAIAFKLNGTFNLLAHFEQTDKFLLNARIYNLISGPHISSCY